MSVIDGTAAGETLSGTAAADTITGAAGNDLALMGGGNDVFVWNPGDGDDTVEGGAGNDTLRFNGENVHETFFIPSSGNGRVILERTILSSVLLDMNDVERIEIQALGGMDDFFIDASGGTDLKHVALDLSNGTPGVGNGGADDVTVFASDGGNTINLAQKGGIVSVTGLPTQISIAAAEAGDIVRIDGEAGNDKISAAALPDVLMLKLDGGEGNDSVTGSLGDDTLEGSEGNDTLGGGGGDDSLSGGVGNDLFVWSPGHGSDTVDGGDGIDTLRFIGGAAAESIDLSAVGGKARLFHDAGGTFVDATEVERIEIRPLGGVDLIEISDLTGTGVTAVAVDLASTATGAAPDRTVDVVSIEATDLNNSIKLASVGGQVVISGLAAQVSVAHADKKDILDIVGLGGDDTIDAGKLAGGKVTLNLFGGSGNDTLTGSAGDDFVLGDAGDDFAFLGAGNDVFHWTPGHGSDTVEGQAGTDVLQFVGAEIGETLNLFANGERAQLFRNVGSSLVDLNDVERVELSLLGGADKVTVGNLSGTDVKLVAIDLSASIGGGDGQNDTVIVDATEGNDKIKVDVSSGALRITGLPAQIGITGAEAGFDTLTINSLGGNDTIDISKLPAGSLPLILDGGAGNDTVTGSVERDYLFGGGDNDLMRGGGGADFMHGDDGNDVIEGGIGNDELFGDAGDDTVIGGTGADVALLGLGNDLFLWALGDGSDVVEGDGDTDTLRLTGSKLDDSVTVAANGIRARIDTPDGAVLDINNVERLEIRALGGADAIAVGDLSGTTLTQVAIDLAATAGGKAADTKIDTVTVSASGGDDVFAVASSKDGKISVTGLAAQVSIEHAGKTDVLILNGGGGADVIDATTLAAGKVALTVNGGVGADVIFGSAGNDTVVGGDGDDTALLGVGNDTFIWNPGDDNDIIEGQDGLDTLRFNGSVTSESIDISANGGRVLLFRNVATVLEDLNDVERIEIQALGGSDSIAVNDLSKTDVTQIAIELGVDGVADGATDQVIVRGTAGNDAVKLASVAGGVAITGLATQVTVAHSEDADIFAIDVLGGNDIVNGAALKANIGRLSVDGGAGNDTLTGGAGNDGLSGGDDNDKVGGGAGDDQVLGGSGNDLLDGGTGNDSLLGGDGNDVLTGGAGDDVATGGLGNDTFTGGAGKDVLRYTSDLDGHDLVIGFDGNAVGGQDTLDLEALFDGLGVLAADRAGRVSIQDKGASVDVFVDADGNLGNGFELTVATLKTSDVITVGQDVLVGT